MRVESQRGSEVLTAEKGIALFKAKENCTRSIQALLFHGGEFTKKEWSER